MTKDSGTGVVNWVTIAFHNVVDRHQTPSTAGSRTNHSIGSIIIKKSMACKRKEGRFWTVHQTPSAAKTRTKHSIVSIIMKSSMARKRKERRFWTN
jgi:hypothetical protein